MHGVFTPPVSKRKMSSISNPFKTVRVVTTKSKELHYPSITVCPWGRTSVGPRSFKDYTEMLHPLKAVLNNVTHKMVNG